MPDLVNPRERHSGSATKSAACSKPVKEEDALHARNQF
jgi:hypothetical protein